MPGLPAKEVLKQELCVLVAAELERLDRAYRATREAATHEEARPQNDKDTRALEQSYLARGQALRVRELTASLAELRQMSVRVFGPGAPVAVGALVTVEEEGSPDAVMLLAPEGGGHRVAQGRVQVVTPSSPLGRALLGKQVGDVYELVVAGRRREMSVLRVE